MIVWLRSVSQGAWEVVSLFAVLNLLGAVALASYLWASGVLDGQKLRQAAAVIRGEPLGPDPSDPAESSEVRSAGARGTPPEAVEPVHPSQSPAVPTDVEMLRLESERIKTEVDQRIALANTVLMRVTAERKRFERQREEAQQQAMLAMRRRDDEGFAQQVAIYEALAPKVAMGHLLSLEDFDEAAAILVAMDTRQAKKIVEAARRPDQMEKMKQVLQRVREVAPEDVGRLALGQPQPGQE